MTTLALIIVTTIVIIGVISIDSMNRNDTPSSLVGTEEKKIKTDDISGEGAAVKVILAVLTILVAIIFNVYSIPIILILALILKLFRTEGNIAEGFFIGVKVILIVCLIVLIGFGLCAAVFLIPGMVSI